MNKVQRLDSHLTNMIAAGEVVERPQGVVKELVDNSIDAGARHISVYIKQGGLEEIMIVDDGEGMSPQDATMAFERHATSKIKDVQDLWQINTMGFRGEALPSIASVSKVNLKTNNGEGATEVEIHYGKMQKAGPCAFNKGTQIIVSNLFQKTPARLKHMKTPQYEFSLISDVIQKFAFAHSEIAFTLYKEDKEVFSTSGRGNMLEVMFEVYGRDVAKTAIKIDSEDDDYQISGYVAQPTFTRASKYYMLFYINGRMIRSYRLQKALLDGYKNYIPSDRYPIAVINITMDPKLVDVNVHPSKWEVRLSKEAQLEKLIEYSIKDALNTQFQVTEIKHKEEKVKVEAQQFNFTYEPKKEVVYTPTIIEEVQQEVREEFASYVTETPKVEPLKAEPVVVQERPVVIEKSVKEETPTIKVEEVPAITQEESKPVVEKQMEEEPIVLEKPALNPSFPQMKVLGQLHGCYILCEGEQGLYIIDQHAAEERYHYEQIQEMVLKGVRDVQPLLLPITLNTTLRVISGIDALNTMSEQIGIHFEAFGNNTLIVRELPIWVNQVDEEKFLNDMLDYFVKNREVNIEDLRKHAIATMACHSSIRFNRNLTLSEMEQVIDDLRHCKQPFHCPHGRPTFISYTLKELEKAFLRVK